MKIYSGSEDWCTLSDFYASSVIINLYEAHSWYTAENGNPAQNIIIFIYLQFNPVYVYVKEYLTDLHETYPRYVYIITTLDISHFTFPNSTIWSKWEQ